MTLMRKDRRRVLCAALASTVAAPMAGWAQAYPARPIRLLCPWQAGGATDVVVRALAEGATRQLRQQVFVENRPGASATLGVAELASARPDGYTLGQMPYAMLRLPHMQKVQFDVLRDFTWIVCLTGYTFGLVVPSESPITSLADLVVFAKANPGRFTYGSTGAGTSPHLAMEDFARIAGIELTHVPFKGTAEYMPALLGGHIMGATDASAWAAQVDSGRVRLLATYGSRRTQRWPQVPTLTEMGYRTVYDSPFGVGGPAGMDAAVVRTLHDAFRRTLSDPAVLAVFEQMDQSVHYLGTQDYTAWARHTFAAEKAAIEKLGLGIKS